MSQGRKGMYYREDLLNQKEIAKKANVAETTVSAVIRGVRRVSIPMAERLEKATGIQREAWAWPQRHYNPYIPIAKKTERR